jgi:hypothetical protein
MNRYIINENQVSEFSKKSEAIFEREKININSNIRFFVNT